MAAHEITAVTGNNGLGKTTFLSCLCGLEKKFRGILEYKGKKYNNRDRQKLCYLVMQDTGNQLFTESVLEEVLISLPKNTENAEGRAAELLGQLDLGEYSNVTHKVCPAGRNSGWLLRVHWLPDGRSCFWMNQQAGLITDI